MFPNKVKEGYQSEGMHGRSGCNDEAVESKSCGIYNGQRTIIRLPILRAVTQMELDEGYIQEDSPKQKE